MKPLTLALCVALVAFGVNRTIRAQGDAVPPASLRAETSTREQDGLNGPVRRLRVETAKVLLQDGKTVESPRALREVSIYDPNGRKIDSVAYPVEGSTLPGKEEYKHDDKGNIMEMVVRADDGSILSKEKYEYEFDEFGNWKKMTSAVAVYENGNLSYEPMEISYRTITYYYGQAVARVGAAPAGTPVSNLTSATSDGNVTDSATSSTAVKENTALPTDIPVPPEDASAKNAVNPSALTSPSFETPFEKGMASLASAKYAVAAEFFRQAVRLDPKNALAYSKLGVAYSAADEHKEAIAAFKQALRLKRVLVDAESYYRLGRAYIALGENAAAVKPLKQSLYDIRAQMTAEVLDPQPRKAAARIPTQLEIHYALGLAYYGSSSFRDAVKEFENAVRLKQDFASAHYGLGLSYLELGDKRSAEKEEATLRKLKSPLANKLASLFLPAPQRNF